MKNPKHQSQPEAFAKGYAAKSLSENPYYASSECGDSFVLGYFSRGCGKAATVQAHKSRGYIWLWDGGRVIVRGNEIHPEKLDFSHYQKTGSISISV